MSEGRDIISNLQVMQFGLRSCHSGSASFHGSSIGDRRGRRTGVRHRLLEGAHGVQGVPIGPWHGGVLLEGEVLLNADCTINR